MSYWE